MYIYLHTTARHRQIPFFVSTASTKRLRSRSRRFPLRTGEWCPMQIGCAPFEFDLNTLLPPGRGLFGSDVRCSMMPAPLRCSLRRNLFGCGRRNSNSSTIRFGRFLLLHGMPVGAQQLHELDAGHEHVHREEAVVFRNDDQRVARPNHAGGKQRGRLRNGQRFGRTAEITQTGDDESLRLGYGMSGLVQFDTVNYYIHDLKLIGTD